MKRNEIDTLPTSILVKLVNYHCFLLVGAVLLLHHLLNW